MAGGAQSRAIRRGVLMDDLGAYGSMYGDGNITLLSRHQNRSFRPGQSPPLTQRR
jgi:hypothetical protein